MKILIVSGLYHPNIFGGTERAVQKLAEALADRGHEAVVVTLSMKRRHGVAGVNGVRVHYLPLANIYFPGKAVRRGTLAKLLWHAVNSYNPFMAASLGRVLDDERPQVVNTHNIGGFSVSAWRAVKSRKLALVNSTHGLDLLCPWFMMRNGKPCAARCPRCRMLVLPKMLLSREVDVLTGVSRYIVERYSQYGAFPNARKLVVYNACEVPQYPPARSYDLEEVTRFGFLGRLHPTKGVDALIEGFLRLRARDVELLIAGRGAPDYERALRQMVNGRSGIRWMGFVSPEVLLRQVHVLVVPSVVNDSAPLAVLEGMSHGLPVIGSCRGGIPELMGEGTGWVFDPGESGALTRALQRAIESRSKLKVMSERATQRAKKFSTEAMVRGYLRAYELAIDKNH